MYSIVYFENNMVDVESRSVIRFSSFWFCLL